MRLVPIGECAYAATLLYKLLEERTPEQSISHQEMPTWHDHLRFLESNPYAHHYLVEDEDGQCAGQCYVTHAGEIGIALFTTHQRMGLGTDAVKALIARHPEAKLANVNPDNEASCRMFEGLGGEVIQVTYKIPSAISNAAAIWALKRFGSDLSDPQAGELP